MRTYSLGMSWEIPLHNNPSHHPGFNTALMNAQNSKNAAPSIPSARYALRRSAFEFALENQLRSAAIANPMLIVAATSQISSPTRKSSPFISPPHDPSPSARNDTIAALNPVFAARSAGVGPLRQLGSSSRSTYGFMPYQVAAGSRWYTEVISSHSAVNSAVCSPRRPPYTGCTLVTYNPVFSSFTAGKSSPNLSKYGEICSSHSVFSVSIVSGSIPCATSSSSPSSGSQIPSASGQSATSAACRCSADTSLRVARRSNHISPCIRWYFSSRSIFSVAFTSGSNVLRPSAASLT